MTKRECLINTICGRPSEKMAWTTIIDETTRSQMPENLRSMPLIDFYRHIGCYIDIFGSYGLPEDIKPKQPFRLVSPCTERYEQAQDPTVFSVIKESPYGTLTAKYKKGHPVKYFVESYEDLKVLYRIWSESYLEQDFEGVTDSCHRTLAAIGNDGIYTPTPLPSPVQQLIETEIGPENFYYFLSDYPDEMEKLMAEMHRCRRQEYEFVASAYPFEAVIPVENTSTKLISPDIYRKYSLPQIRDYCDILHKHGKKAIVHMCGHLRGLLREFAETGMDGIHTLTPPPIGDCEYEHALDVLGDKLVIFGCMDGEVFHNPNATLDDIRDWLDRTLTPRLKQANFILLAGADGIPTTVDKFYILQEWFEKNGNK
jgi:hypothetical protein